MLDPIIMTTMTMLATTPERLRHWHYRLDLEGASVCSSMHLHVNCECAGTKQVIVMTVQVTDWAAC